MSSIWKEQTRAESEVPRMTAPQQQKLKITGPVVVTANRCRTAPSSI
jgi:hypothetical protein